MSHARAACQEGAPVRRGRGGQRSAIRQRADGWVLTADGFGECLDVVAVARPPVVTALRGLPDSDGLMSDGPDRFSATTMAGIRGTAHAHADGGCAAEPADNRGAPGGARVVSSGAGRGERPWPAVVRGRFQGGASCTSDRGTSRTM